MLPRTTARLAEIAEEVIDVVEGHEVKMGEPYRQDQAMGFPLIFGDERVESWIVYWRGMILNITEGSENSPVFPNGFGVSVLVNHNTVQKIRALGPDDTQIEFESAVTDNGTTVITMKETE